MACILAAAQNQSNTGSLTGRLTDLWSHPVAGATIVLRNQSTGTEARAETTSNGMYRFDALEPGAYAMHAVAASGAGEVSGIVIAPGFHARVSAAIEFHAFHPVTAPEETPTLSADNDRRPLATAFAAASMLRQHLNDAHRADAEGIIPAAADVAAVLTAVPLENAGLTAMPVAFSHTESRDAAAPGHITSAASEYVASHAPEVSAVLPVVPLESADVVVEPVLMASAEGAPDGPAHTPIEIAAERLPSDHVIRAEELEALPLKSRDWSAFVLDHPEGAPHQSAANEEQPAASHSAIALDSLQSGSAFPARRSGRGSSLTGAGEQLGEDAVGEVRTARPADAELREPGEQFVETRHGGNELHGQGFVFDRHNVLGARNPFAQWVKETAPATATSVPQFTAVPYSPGDQRTTWGIGAGGRLPHRRGSWFSALDGDDRNNPAVAMPRHADQLFAQPSNDEMQVLSARLRLNAGNPVSDGLQEYSKVLEQLAGLLGPTNRTSHLWTGFGRVDATAGERQRFAMEATATGWRATGGGLTRVSEPYGSHSFGDPKSSTESVLGRWEVFLSPNLLATTTGAFRRQTFAPQSEKPSQFESGLLANLWGQLPQIVVDSRNGLTIGNLSRFGPGTYPQDRGLDLQQRLDWVHGSLLLKGGFEYRHDSNATSLVRNHYGTYVYSRAENFASDVLAFEKFGLADALDPQHQHNCDQRGRAWRDANGQLHGLGYLPCYSYYTQTLGPANWHVSTNDWAGWMTAQWQPVKSLVLSAAVRWDHQAVPGPLALVDNPALPLTQASPALGNEWAPRISVAWGLRESHLPVLQLSYGAYYGRTSNAVLENALTQTGSPKGNLRYFVRPTDNLAGGDAPAFPYVFAGLPTMMQKPAALEFAPRFKNPEIHQGEAALDEQLPGHVFLNVAAVASLGRRLPMVRDTNIDAAANPGAITYAVVDASHKGPIQQPQITVPFYASWPTSNGGRLMPQYQQISNLESRGNSTYEALQVRVVRTAAHGITVRARYTWGQAWDWNPDETSAVMGSSLFDPANFSLENGRSDLDVRHSASGWISWDAPWRHSNARWWSRGWRASAIGQYRSGLPFTMRTAGSLPELTTGAGDTIVALGPSMNGYGGDNRVYGVGRNTFRYPGAWKADVRIGRRIALGHERELELLAESFNLLNHQNVTQLETTGYYISAPSTAGALPRLEFMTGMKPGQTEFGKPLNVNATDYYRERQFDFGARLRFRVAFPPDDWDY